jgi:hypothetical protein
MSFHFSKLIPNHPISYVYNNLATSSESSRRYPVIPVFEPSSDDDDFKLAAVARAKKLRAAASSRVQFARDDDCDLRFSHTAADEFADLCGEWIGRGNCNSGKHVRTSRSSSRAQKRTVNQRKEKKKSAAKHNKEKRRLAAAQKLDDSARRYARKQARRNRRLASTAATAARTTGSLKPINLFPALPVETAEKQNIARAPPAAVHADHVAVLSVVIKEVASSSEETVFHTPVQSLLKDPSVPAICKSMPAPTVKLNVESPSATEAQVSSDVSRTAQVYQLPPVSNQHIAQAEAVAEDEVTPVEQ